MTCNLRHPRCQIWHVTYAHVSRVCICEMCDGMQFCMHIWHRTATHCNITLQHTATHMCNVTHITHSPLGFLYHLLCPLNVWSHLCLIFWPAKFNLPLTIFLRGKIGSLDWIETGSTTVWLFWVKQPLIKLQNYFWLCHFIGKPEVKSDLYIELKKALLQCGEDQ